MLRSHTYQEFWPIGKVLTAACRDFSPAGPHDSPGLIHECGIHGVKTRAQLVPWIPSYSSVIKLYGKVSLWGTVIDHEEGYRAQYAYPYAIYVDLSTPFETLSKQFGSRFEVARYLRHTYKVDVEVREDRDFRED